MPATGQAHPVGELHHQLRIRVRVGQKCSNIKTGALAREYAQDRITPAAYGAARTYKAVLERLRRPVSGARSWNFGSKVDQVLS